MDDFGTGTQSGHKRGGTGEISVQLVQNWDGTRAENRLRDFIKIIHAFSPNFDCRSNTKF